jgi:putative tryptophan/tyrosine transport system substrate-binding protein
MTRHCALLVLACGLLGVTASTLAGEPAQKVVRMGVVWPDSPSTAPPGVPAFWARLRELGWVEGQNLVVEQRSPEGHFDRLPALMVDVVGQKVDVLVTYSTPAAIAAKNATSTVPIVDVLMGDPVGTGLAASLARPGGNLTGLSNGWADIAGKWLELLREAVPRLSTVAVIANPDGPLFGLAKEI